MRHVAECARKTCFEDLSRAQTTWASSRLVKRVVPTAQRSAGQGVAYYLRPEAPPSVLVAALLLYWSRHSSRTRRE